MSTTVVYNGVTIRDVLTENVSYRTVSDQTGNDPIYTEVTVQIRGTIHTTDISGTAEASQHGLSVWSAYGTNLSAGLAYFCEQLAKPRGEFVLSIGGNVLFHVWPSRLPGTGADYSKRNTPVNFPIAPGQRPDVNNGPHTQLRVHNVIGSSSATVGLTITFCIEQQTPSGVRQRDLAGITNLRWWFSEDITGRDNTTVRTTHGRIRVANHDVNVHFALRMGYVLPPLQGGFHRKSVAITESPSGLEAEFTVVDEEVHVAPPAPATWWDVRHRISSPTAGGAIVESDMTVDLMAPKNVDKRALVSLAIKIIDTKTHLLESLAAADPTKTGAILMSAHFEDHCTDGRLSAAVRFRHHPQTTQDESSNPVTSKTFLNTLKEDFGKRITSITGYTYGGKAYNPDKAQPMFQTATAVGLYRALLQTSDYPVEMPQTAAVLGTPDEEGETYTSQVNGKEVETTVTAAPLDDWEDGYSNEHKAHPFMSQVVESELRTPSGSIVLPVAGGSAVAGSRVVSLHRAFCTRRITMDCERVDRPPPLLTDATFSDGGAVHTLLRKQEVPMSPVLSADARHTIYRVIAEYEYSLSQVPTSVPYGKVQSHNGSLAAITKLQGATSGAIA